MDIIYIGILIIVLLSIASIAKSIMDTINFRFEISVFSKIKNKKQKNWWDQKESWKNKYKDRDSRKGPAFWGSTTFFVWITDAWHFFQMINLTCYDIAIAIPIIVLLDFSLYYILVIVIILKIWKSIIFELFWQKLLK